MPCSSSNNNNNKHNTPNTHNRNREQVFKRMPLLPTTWCKVCLTVWAPVVVVTITLATVAVAVAVVFQALPVPTPPCAPLLPATACTGAGVRTRPWTPSTLWTPKQPATRRGLKGVLLKLGITENSRKKHFVSSKRRKRIGRCSLSSNRFYFERSNSELPCNSLLLKYRKCHKYILKS